MNGWQITSAGVAQKGTMTAGGRERGHGRETEKENRVEKEAG